MKKKSDELGPKTHEEDEPGLEGRGIGLRTLRLVVTLGHPHKDVIRQLETPMEFRTARALEKDLTVRSLKKIRKIMFALWRLVTDKHLVDIQQVILNNKFKRKTPIF